MPIFRCKDEDDEPKHHQRHRRRGKRVSDGAEGAWLSRGARPYVDIAGFGLEAFSPRTRPLRHRERRRDHVSTDGSGSLRDAIWFSSRRAGQATTTLEACDHGRIGFGR
jgi:hypothetical protein